MDTKCRDITKRITELENRINNISKPKKFISEKNEKSSAFSPNHRKKSMNLRQRPSTAPQDSSSTSLRFHVARHMINQMQVQISGNGIDKTTLSELKSHSKYWTNNKDRPVSAAPAKSTVYTKDRYRSEPQKCHAHPTTTRTSDVPESHSRKKSSSSSNHVTERLGSDEYWTNIIRDKRHITSAEKESDALVSKKENETVPIISIRKPPHNYCKPFCECMMHNPYNIKQEIPKQEVIVMGMANRSSACWPKSGNFESSSLTSEAPVFEDKKLIDNFLIDSLRGEIEKVRHKLCEIGSRPTELSEDIKERVSKEPARQKAEVMLHDKDQKLLDELKQLQKKNEELSKALLDHKERHEASVKKAQEAKELLHSYETKVNQLHEQALKSSQAMAQSKEKYCNILRSRNCQIKNLYEINQQLKKSIIANEEQMKQLKVSYKIVKSRYAEINEKDKLTEEENYNLKESMRKLENELKLVYKECSVLKEENMRFLVELKELKEGVSNQYNSKLAKHRDFIQEILIKNNISETTLMEEVQGIAHKLHYHGNELEEMKKETRIETSELQYKYQKLMHQYQTLVKKFQEYEQFDEIKCSCIERELKEFSLKMKEKEGIILRERDELRNLVEELSRALNCNKTAITELHNTNHHQENMISNLKENVKKKNEQLCQYQSEMESIRQQYEDSEREIEALRRIIETTKLSCEDQKLSKELETVRKSLNEEKNSNQIKQSLIGDQEKTICNLKEQLGEKSKEIEKIVERLNRMTDETQRLSDKLKFLEKELDRERLDKTKGVKEAEDMKESKQALSKKVWELEETIKSCMLDNSVTSEGDSLLVAQLEKQMKKEKEDWEIERQILQNDKEKALHAARFASQKLLDTVNDFQKQMCQQKTAENRLAKLLHGKEQQLECLTTKVKSLLPSPFAPFTKHPSQIEPSHQQSICASFCHLKQIYRDSRQQFCQSVHSDPSAEDSESKVFCMEKSNCSTCCDFSDN